MFVVLFVLVNCHNSYDVSPILVIFGIMLSHLHLKVGSYLPIGAMCSSQDIPVANYM